MMRSPHHTVLIKIFVRGFYQAHAGLLLFAFVTLVMYCFFIQPLNQTHLQADEILKQNLIIVLTIISSPVVMIMVFILWMIFTIKSWTYVKSQALLPQNMFLRYSTTSMHKTSQFKSWFIIQTLIALPLLIYAVFCLITGILFGYYLNGLLILLFVFVLSTISAALYTQSLNTPIDIKHNNVFAIIAARWHKPYFSLFVYHALDKLIISLLITKVLSYTILTGGLHLFSNIDDTIAKYSIITLCIVITHAFLIYEFYKFERTQLSFVRNFPYSKIKIFSGLLLTYLIITLPESILFLVLIPFKISLQLLIMNVSIALLLKNLLYVMIPDIRRFVYCVFYLFVLCYLIILSGFAWVLGPVSLLLSIAVFHRDYYSQKTMH